MDFPFEYVERVFSYPSFDNHLVTKSALNALSKNYVKKPKELPGSEEEEIDGDTPNDVDDIVVEQEKAMLKEIKKLEIEVKKEENGDLLSSECSSSDSDGWESLVDTSDTDVVGGLFSNEQERNEMLLRKYKLMNDCCCTESECKSNSEISFSSSSSSTSTSSEEVESVEVNEERTEMPVVPEKEGVSTSSDETTSSSDDEMNIDDEIEYLEEMLKEIEKAEDRRGGNQDDDENSDDSENENGSMFEEVKSKSNSKPGEKSNMEPTAGVQTSLTSSDSSTTTVSSELSQTDSLVISSSDPDDDEDSENNVENFNWQSDDLYESTDTDSEIEKTLNYLDAAMATVESVFANAAVVGDDTPLLKEKIKNFQQPMPDFLETKKTYEMMEEQESRRHNIDIIAKQLWLVQQLDSGCMCSAKLVNRKNPDHLQLQRNIDKERRLLHELLPELSKPSHIARLVDMGYDQNFKFLIFEDLGMDLLTLFEEFGPVLSPATVFLISYFTFNSLKELHSFDLLHMDVRPSVFNVIHFPFNIKITDYSKCIRRRVTMKTPEDARPDSFSPRVFHQKNANFDEFVDFESWIYTMIYLCTNRKLPWFEDPPNMLKGKETFFNDPFDLCYGTCADPVPMAAGFIADQKVTYEQFMQKMNLIFSVDVMQFSDKNQPRLWTIKELEEIKKSRISPDSDNEELIEELIESHWNPAFESDSDDGKEKDEKNEKEDEAKKPKNEKKKEEKSGSQSSSSFSEPSSNNEQLSGTMSETNSGLEKKKPPKTVTKKIQPPTRSPPKRVIADHMMLMEATSGLEQFSMPSNMAKKKTPEVKTQIPPPKLEKEKQEKAIEKPSAPPIAPKGKKNRRPLLTREFLLEMKQDLYGSQSSISSELSAASFSTWTSSTWSSDEGEVKKRFKWSRKSDEESIVEYFDDLNRDEMENHKQYENLVALCLKEDVASTSSSGEDPLSDIDTDEKQSIMKIFQKREEQIGWELHSDKAKSQDEMIPEDHPKEIEKLSKKM